MIYDLLVSHFRNSSAKFVLESIKVSKYKWIGN